MQKPALITISFVLLFVLFASTLSIVFAQECKAPENPIKELQTPWPPAPIGGYTLTPDSKLSDLTGYVFGWGIGLAGLAVFIALIIAGVEYITSIDNPAKREDAKKRITSAVAGLALLLSSFAIFQVINPNLTQIKKDLPEIKKTGVGGSVAFPEKQCADRFTCCEGDLNCDPKNWICCQAGNSYCIEHQGVASSHAEAGFAYLDDGQRCRYNMECKNNWCKNDAASGTGRSCATPLGNGSLCSSNYECANNNCYCDTETWQKKCGDNPKICIKVFNQPEIGCDVVRFYAEPDFQGTSIDFTAPDAAQAGAGTFNSSDYVWFDQVFPGNASPMSYQAFSYQRDDTADKNIILGGDGKPKEQPCGITACGCQIARCLTPDSGGKCRESTVDPNSGEFSELAYSAGVSNTQEFYGAMIKDKTKQSIWDAGSGFVGWLKDVYGMLSGN